MSRSARLRNAGLLAAWLVFAVLALWGTPGVPFHPDESTYLYASRDFDLLFRQGNPAAVTWRAAYQPLNLLNYRLLDPPLTHYLPGLGRLLGGYAQGLPRDWDWAASWAANASVGALPDAGMLTAARWPAALLTVLSVLPVYGIGARLGGTAGGLAAALLYALSGLVLLHGRRAMAEGPLLFFSLATIWALLRWPRLPILAGALAALALASKLTALSLLPVVGLALLVQTPATGSGLARWRAPALALLLSGLTFLVLSWVLTPALWAHPKGGLIAMVDARQQLMAGQVGGVSAAAPVQVVSSLGQRLFAMLYHVYFAPPAFWDISNYALATRASELSYLSVPLQGGWHTTSLADNLLAGGAVLTLTLAGIGFSIHDLAAHRLAAAVTIRPEQKGALLVLLAWTAATIAVLLPVTIAWQRYYLPLVPIACLWAAYGLTSVLRPFVQAARR